MIVSKFTNIETNATIGRSVAFVIEESHLETEMHMFGSSDGDRYIEMRQYNRLGKKNDLIKCSPLINCLTGEKESCVAK